jgi:hypothetical protein
LSLPCGRRESDSRPCPHNYGFAGCWSPRERGTMRRWWPDAGSAVPQLRR